MAGGPLHDRDGVIWLDGALVPWRDANLHVLSHGLHYATSVFEGERAYDGVIFRLAEHSQRLVDSAEVLGMALPYSAAQLEQATRAVVAAQRIRDGYVRPVAWRGSESLGMLAPDSRVHVAIATWEWPNVFDPELRLKGIRLHRSAWARPGPQTAPVKAKASSHYTIGVLAREAAQASGFDDALMLDWRGYVAEASGANLFMVQDGRLYTPIPDCFLNGITRQAVIELARERGLVVEEVHLTPERLAEADEVFLTGTAYEVQPVRAIEDTSFTVGPITRQLVQDFSDLVRRSGSAAGAAA